jgi:putative ABC transport system substrate-binding protein
MSGKWLELLKEIVPGVARVAVLRDPTTTVDTGEFAAIQTAAPSLGVEVTPLGVRDSDEIERGISAFARASNGGLIIAGSPAITRHSKLITRPAVSLATAPIGTASIDAVPVTSIRSSRASNQPTCP